MDARRFRSFFALSLVVVDTAMLVLSFLIAHRWRKTIPWPTPAVDVPEIRDYTGVLFIFVASTLMAFFIFRLYHLPRAISVLDEVYTIGRAVTVGTLLAVAVSALVLKNSVFEVNLPRLMVAYFWVNALVLVGIGRYILQTLRNILRSRGWVQDRVLIVGSGEAAELVLQKIKGSPFLGYRVLGLVSADGLPDRVADTPVIGSFADLPRLVEDLNADEVIITLPDAPDDELVHLIGLSYRDRTSVKLFPNVYNLITSGVTIDDLGGLPLLSMRDVALRGWKLTVKRAIDLVGSLVGLILLSPLLMLLALLIKLDSKGPALFVQERMGLDGKLFPLIKFRSMRTDAEAAGPGWTTKDDPRVTRLGRFLRRRSLDELPQLINVLFGEMSLVGPRPEQPAYVNKFRELIPRYMERHREKAGMTGWAQVNGLRGDTSISERTKYDLWYVENWSVWLDIKILLRTFVRVFMDRNAY
ncbi:MAG: undecaprenyl-phosphate glucose phosphotransferase [Anaerolineales bacterium]|nr:undecaprenyl-phosphate glucose phosphotransferase [Anaerolineales bacterium]